MPAHITLPPEPQHLRTKFEQAIETTYGRLEDGTLGFRSTGFDAHDMIGVPGGYAGMHVSTQKLEGNRQLEVPDWVRDPKKLIEVYVRTLERRAHVWRYAIAAPIKERLHLAHKRLELKRGAQLCQLLDRLCAQEFELRQIPTRTPFQQKKMKDLQESIHGVDTELRCVKGEIILQVIDLYWRLGWNAKQVAEHLGFSHAHIRQILWRLRRTAERLEQEKTKTPEHANEWLATKKTKICAFCGNQFLYVPNGHERKYCGRQCFIRHRKIQTAVKYFCSAMCKLKFEASGQGNKPVVGNFVSQFTTA